MITIMYEGHRIEVKPTSLSGTERVYYDGEEVTSKWSMTGSTHVFRVTESGEEAQYEVEISLRWHGFGAETTVRRNGQIIFTNR